MNNRLLCGRLILTRDGTIQKLEVADGGSTRIYGWDNEDMNFEEVQRRLINIHNLSKM